MSAFDPKRTFHTLSPGNLRQAPNFASIEIGYRLYLTRKSLEKPAGESNAPGRYPVAGDVSQ